MAPSSRYVVAPPTTATAVLLVWALMLLYFLSPLPIPTSILSLTTNDNAASSLNSTSVANTEGEGTLITYVYSETDESRKNLIFFINHGLHDKADFMFIFNGETDVSLLLPDKPNIKFVHRSNTCYDLGAHAEVLIKDDLWLKYKRYILMNASVRGPFMPHWAGSCWSDRFLSKITDDVKLVGLSVNCWPTPHVQSMFWVTDRAGLSLLLYPPADSPPHDEWMEVLFENPDDFPRPPGYKSSSDPDWIEKGLNTCFENRQRAIEAEIGATRIILGAGKKVDVMLMKFQTEPDYTEHCARLGPWDPQAEGAYDGVSIHPFETVFFKTNRGISPLLVDLMTEWIDKIEYSSYDYC